jgi:hypothetical protein
MDEWWVRQRPQEGRSERSIAAFGWTYRGKPCKISRVRTNKVISSTNAVYYLWGPIWAVAYHSFSCFITPQTAKWTEWLSCCGYMTETTATYLNTAPSLRTSGVSPLRPLTSLRCALSVATCHDRRRIAVRGSVLLLISSHWCFSCHWHYLDTTPLITSPQMTYCYVTEQFPGGGTYRNPRHLFSAVALNR